MKIRLELLTLLLSGSAQKRLLILRRALAIKGKQTAILRQLSLWKIIESVVYLSI